MNPRPTAAPASTHHGDVLHFPLVVLGRGGGLCGGPLPGGAGRGSCLLQVQVGIADIVLRGLEHLGEEAQVPLPQKDASPSAALAHPLPASPAAPTSPSPTPAPSFLAVSSTPSGHPGLAARRIWTLGHMVCLIHLNLKAPKRWKIRKAGGSAVWYSQSDLRGSLTCSGGIPAAKRQKQPELESSSWDWEGPQVWGREKEKR